MVDIHFSQLALALLEGLGLIASPCILPILPIMLNGKPATGADVKNGVLTVNREALYELIDQGESKNGVLELQTDAPGLQAYAFTFGS